MEDFYKKGSNWHSNQYILEGRKKGFYPEIKWQILPSGSLPADYFKEFVEYIIKKYPNPNHYKPILVRLAGWFGKWKKEEKSGYVETDCDMANSAFWDNNPDQIGFTCDKNLDRKNF